MQSFNEPRREPPGPSELQDGPEAARPHGDAAAVRDGTTSDAQFRELVRHVLLDAVRSARYADFADRDRRGLAQRLCSEAKLYGLRAEQLIIVLKEVWYRLPEARRLQIPDADDILAQVITTCIEEYYGYVIRRRAE